MTDITIINKEVKKMKSHKKPSEPVEEERWAEQRWEKRQPERLEHIRKKKEDESHEKAKKPLPEAGPPHRGRRV